VSAQAKKASRFDAAMMLAVLGDISAERVKQDAKWGEQNHPSVDTVLASRVVYDAQRMTEEYEIPSEARAKFLCDENFRRGVGTWAHIAVEELSEAVSAEGDEVRRGELVQLAAVVVAWIECIDRRVAGERR
jgi:hypothetical protein